MAGYDPLRGGERPSLGADEPAPVDDLLGDATAPDRAAGVVVPAPSPARKVVIAKKSVPKKAASKKSAAKKAASKKSVPKKAASRKSAAKKASVERSAANGVDAVGEPAADSTPSDRAPRDRETTRAPAGPGEGGATASTGGAATVTAVSGTPSRSFAHGSNDVAPVGPVTPVRARPATGVRTRWRVTVLAAVIVALVVLSLRRRRADGPSGVRRP